MNSAAVREDVVWRVGHRADPLGFTPRQLCAWNHRFDDASRRFRTVYVAEAPETALREVIADFRPNHTAIARFREALGDNAATDLPRFSITASWRHQHVLALAQLYLDGPLCDLTDVATRHDIEARHVDVLRAHGMSHLDLHEVTSRRREVTQSIAAALYDSGTAAIRFPSRLDGAPCLALFEGRGRLVLAGEPLALTDPPPAGLLAVATAWELVLEPADQVPDDPGWTDADTATMIHEEPW